VHIFYPFKNKAIEIVLAMHEGWCGEHPQLFTGVHLSHQAFLSSLLYLLSSYGANREPPVPHWRFAAWMSPVAQRQRFGNLEER
jgi:hypothetical protein